MKQIFIYIILLLSLNFCGRYNLNKTLEQPKIVISEQLESDNTKEISDLTPIESVETPEHKSQPHDTDHKTTLIIVGASLAALAIISMLIWKHAMSDSQKNFISYMAESLKKPEAQFFNYYPDASKLNDIPKGSVKLNIPSTQTRSIPALYHKGNNSKPLIVSFIGKGSSTQSGFIMRDCEFLSQEGCSLLSFDYQHTDSVKDVIQDSVDVLKYASENLGHQDIIILAASMGSISSINAVLKLQKNHSIKPIGIIVLNGVNSLKEIAAHYLKSNKALSVLARNIISDQYAAYNTFERLSRLEIPILAFQHTKDDIVLHDKSFAQALSDTSFKVLSEIHFITEESGYFFFAHGDLLSLESVKAKIKDFISRLEK
jgi:hypothetical protein